MYLKKQRKAFSMITAIFIIVLMASVSLFILSLSGKMVKDTTLQFQREQAVLLSKSYTEYALMAVTANQHTTANCLNEITGTYGDYDIRADISYIGSGIDPSCTRILSNTVSTLNSPLNIIIDVFIKYPDYDHPGDLNLTYHQRTLQKI